MLKALFPALGLAGLATAAGAHVTLEQSEATIGSTMKITLRVPHGCDGAATNGLTVTLPDGVYDAKPMPKPGWTLATVTGAYATPFTSHGTTVTEGVREIAWTGGALDAAWYDEFTFRATLGTGLVAGDALSFPTVQDCTTATTDWTDTSGAPDVPNPAPSLTLVAGGAGHDDHAAAAPGTEVGALRITAPFSRATLPNAPVAGGFLTITNTGTTDDRLIAAASEAAGRIEVHEMEMKGDVMRMRELKGGLPIPAGATVSLDPGGYHIMFMDLAHPFARGTSVPVTLTFEKAGSVDVALPIGAPNARGPADAVASQ